MAICSYLENRTWCTNDKLSNCCFSSSAKCVLSFASVLISLFGFWSAFCGGALYTAIWLRHLRLNGGIHLPFVRSAGRFHAAFVPICGLFLARSGMKLGLKNRSSRLLCEFRSGLIGPFDFTFYEPLLVKAIFLT